VDAKHLTSDEIQLLAQSRALGPDEDSVSVPEGVREHADSCETCDRLVSMQVAFRRKLALLKSSHSSSKSPDCPDPETLWELASGVLLPDRSILVFQHAASCDFCSYGLRVAMEQFEADPTPGEEDLANEVAQFRLQARPNFARELALRTARTPARTANNSQALYRFSFGRIVLALTGAAALLVVLYFGIPTILHDRPSYAEHLLAEAYTSARPFEARMRGAAFAPLKIERGGQRSQTERPPTLLEAEALAGRKLGQRPNDPDWLRVRGQADLLDGRYALATTAFRRALDLRPNSPELQVDFATALFQKAQAENNAPDYAAAADLLSKVIQRNPTDQIAIFNRALILERLFLFDQAVADWEQYLRIDSSGGWASEARQHLENVKHKQQEKRSGSGKLLLPPHEVGARNLTSDSARFREVNQRIEEYLSVALREWHVGVYSDTQSSRKEPGFDLTSQALRNIATVLTDYHGDSWLQDFLSSHSSSHFESGLEALRDAIISSDGADYPAAFKYAVRAEALFRRDGNFAGMMRARFERVYALQFSNNGLDCAQDARALESALQHRRYAWIAQQTMIEEGICRNLLGEFGPASVALESAGTAASASGYPVTRIRALVMQGLVLWDSGKSAIAWQKLREAAECCWSDHCPDAALYTVYANMDNFAEDSMLWHVQMFAAGQAVATAENDPDLLMRAVEHSRLANAAMLAGFPKLAKENFQIADRLLADAPRSEVTNNYEAGINIDSAKLALAQGDPPAAEQYLARAEARIPHISDYYLLADFFLTRARVQFKAGANIQAEASLHWAVALAERQLSSLSSQKDRFSWSQQSGDVYRELVAMDLKRGNINDAFEEWEWYLAAPRRIGSFEAAETPSSKPGNSDIFVLNRSAGPAPSLPRMPSNQTILPNMRGQTLVSYAILSNRLGAWIFDDRGVYFRWLASDASEVLRLGRAFAELCGNPSADPQILKSEGEVLYGFLIDPLADRLPAGHPLLIDGESSILNIPLSALVDHSGKYILESFSLSILPGVYLLPSKNSLDRIDSLQPTLVVDYSGSAFNEEGLHPLPASANESDAIAAKFRSSRVLRGTALSLSALKREIRSAVVFHYAGHSSPSESTKGLLISGRVPGDEVVVFDSSTIRSLRPLNARLVTLSACATVDGRKGGLANDDSLSYAFLEIGVPHVVASRWNVDSATTARLMQEFYSKVLSGETVAEALRQAELDIRSSPETSAPYFWAAFDSYGTS
jgi:tetratricopeptide (TPR) repeat protein